MIREDRTGRDDQIRLTQLSHGAGCACKIGAGELSAVREAVEFPRHPDLLVGLDPADDSAVFRVSDEIALVQSVDFFTPIVDDPYDFGRIAATNALSDIYAMGAKPVMALNIVAFSLEDLGREVLTQILRGGADVARQAGIAVAGGHSIDDKEPKYGMVVTGTVHPDRVLTNAGGQVGDFLHLSKPIGGGLVTTSAKRGLVGDEVVDRCVEVMTTRNESAAEGAIEAGAHALTDVTGFGLLGHLHEMCEASGLAAEIDADLVPVIDGVRELAANPRCVAGGTRRNAEYAEGFTAWDPRVSETDRVILVDAMTSGGLLSAVPGDRKDPRLGPRIGRLVEGDPGVIRIN